MGIFLIRGFLAYPVCREAFKWVALFPNSLKLNVGFKRVAGIQDGIG